MATTGGPPWSPANGSGSPRPPPGTGGSRPATACGCSRAMPRGASLCSRRTHPRPASTERDLFPPEANAMDGIPRLRLVSSFPLGALRGQRRGGKGVSHRRRRAHGLFVRRLLPAEVVAAALRSALPRTTTLRARNPSRACCRRNISSGWIPWRPWSPESRPQSGVRTMWWVWEAPEDGRYTWSLTDPGGLSLSLFPTHSRLRVTVFTGSSVEDLYLVAESRMDAEPSDFVFQAARPGSGTGSRPAFRPVICRAISDSRCLQRKLSGGQPPATTVSPARRRWSGATGSTTGSNRFATMEPSERVGPLGHSSLWWRYEAPRFGMVQNFGSTSPWLPGCWPSTGKLPVVSDRSSS